MKKEVFFYIILAFTLAYLIQFHLPKIRRSTSVTFIKKDNYVIIGELENNGNIRDNEYYLIAFFNQICITCPNGFIISQLKQLTKPSERLHILAVFPEDFSVNDMENLRINLEINFALKRANELSDDWSEIWHRWMLESQKRHYSYGAFFMNREGRVLQVLVPGRENKFFRFIKEKIAKDDKEI